MTSSDEDIDLPVALPEFQKQPGISFASAGGRGSLPWTGVVRPKARPTERVAMATASDVIEASIDAVLAVCPDLSRHDVARDLRMSGGAQQTINRVFDDQFLSGIAADDDKSIPAVRSPSVSDSSPPRASLQSQPSATVASSAPLQQRESQSCSAAAGRQFVLTATSSPRHMAAAAGVAMNDTLEDQPHRHVSSAGARVVDAYGTATRSIFDDDVCNGGAVSDSDSDTILLHSDCSDDGGPLSILQPPLGGGLTSRSTSSRRTLNHVTEGVPVPGPRAKERPTSCGADAIDLSLSDKLSWQRKNCSRDSVSDFDSPLAARGSSRYFLSSMDSAKCDPVDSDGIEAIANVKVKQASGCHGHGAMSSAVGCSSHRQHDSSNISFDEELSPLGKGVTAGAVSDGRRESIESCSFTVVDPLVSDDSGRGNGAASDDDCGPVAETPNSHLLSLTGMGSSCSSSTSTVDMAASGQVVVCSSDSSSGAPSPLVYGESDDSAHRSLGALQPTAKRKPSQAPEPAREKQDKDRIQREKKAAKDVEKQRKQLEKARDKAQKQISAEVRQANNREQSLKMMHLVADSRLWDFAGWAAIFTMLTSSAEDMADGQTILGACGTGADPSKAPPSSVSRASAASKQKASSAARVTPGDNSAFGMVVEEEKMPVANSVRWRRKVVQGAFDEDSQDIVRDVSFKEEDHAVVLWSAEDFAECISQCDGDDSSLQRAGDSLQDAFPGLQVTLLLVGVLAYLGQCKNLDNRGFRTAVRRLGEGAGDGADACPAARKKNGARRNPAPSVVLTKVQVDDALVTLQLLCPGLRIRQTETTFETARLLFQLTKSIAHDPARKSDATPFSFYAEGQSLRPVKIDANGVGCSRAWQQQLRQIHGVGHEKAAAISKTFASPRRLLEACLTCADDKAIDQLMTSIEVRRGTGVVGRVTRVGKDFGRQLHRFILSRDGAELLDGSGGRSTSPYQS